MSRENMGVPFFAALESLAAKGASGEAASGHVHGTGETRVTRRVAGVVELV